MPVILLATFGLILVMLAVMRWTSTLLAYRGDRVVTCPENERAAGVRVDALRAAASSFAGGPRLRLHTCSRWPEKAGCGQECLREIETAPADCLVRNIVARWYEGKGCVSCGNPIGPIEWGPNQPALLCADEKSVEWKQVQADLVFETLEAAVPVCFACHMANSLVREHPDLAIDRGRYVEKSRSMS
jgi:hypothetical protein